MSLAEVEKLIKDGDAISDALPSLNILKESAKKAKEWLTKSGELLKHPDHKQYIDVLETLVQRGRPLPVKLGTHSSQFQGLCLMKSSSETLQNLPYFIYTKTQSCFFRFSFRATLYFYIMNALVYVDIDQGIH